MDSELSFPPVPFERMLLRRAPERRARSVSWLGSKRFWCSETSRSCGELLLHWWATARSNEGHTPVVAFKEPILLQLKRKRKPLPGCFGHGRYWLHVSGLNFSAFVFLTLCDVSQNPGSLNLGEPQSKSHWSLLGGIPANESTRFSGFSYASFIKLVWNYQPLIGDRLSPLRFVGFACKPSHSWHPAKQICMTAPPPAATQQKSPVLGWCEPGSCKWPVRFQN